MNESSATGAKSPRGSTELEIKLAKENANLRHDIKTKKMWIILLAILASLFFVQLILQNVFHIKIFQDGCQNDYPCGPGY
jgi:hypothetical protein